MSRFGRDRSPRRLLIAGLALALAACSAPRGPSVSTVPPEQARPPGSSVPAASQRSRGGGYYLDDGPGDRVLADLASIPDAVPRYEPIAVRATRPYVVFGREYVPMSALAPYRERGVASWYGKRYHGRRTSIGEVYDMNAMTGAHPTLPLPSYVRVTHAGNGRSVVVRLNDRGPFLHGRVIDLSYVAAAKLGYVDTGSAEVDVELITEFDASAKASPAVPPAASPPAAFYLQFGAFSSAENARAALSRVAQATGVEAQQFEVLAEEGLHKLHQGPYPTRAAAAAFAARLRGASGAAVYVVER